MLYRIYTETIPEKSDLLTEAISKFFEGFLILKANGFWKGVKENSQVIEIVADECDSKIQELAGGIKEMLGQEAVLVQKIRNENWFI